FLRHSFNRIDLVAVICYWIDLVLMLSGVSHLYVFKALSTLRSLRLLTVTSGGSTILQSLKTSAPLLVNGSFRRRCVWLDPDGANNFIISQQWCGGYVGSDGLHHPYISLTEKQFPTFPKGYLCPVGQICTETENPFNNMVSYDNIFSAMVLTFVLAATQGWTDLLYRTMDTDYGWATLYYVLSILILNFWLLNLFVAVIVTVFEKIREETSHSAFTTSKSAPILLDDEGEWTLKDHKKVETNQLDRIMKKIKYFWVFCIFIDLFIMGFRTYDMPPSTALLIDLLLAIITCFIQVPVIKSSPAYPYLTIFQIVRVYRVVIAVPRLKNVL
ncbi:31514_t:CDS:2, partial [Racocetra persica]